MENQPTRRAAIAITGLAAASTFVGTVNAAPEVVSTELAQLLTEYEVHQQNYNEVIARQENAEADWEQNRPIFEIEITQGRMVDHSAIDLEAVLYGVSKEVQQGYEYLTPELGSLIADELSATKTRIENAHAVAVEKLQAARKQHAISSVDLELNSCSENETKLRCKIFAYPERTNADRKAKLCFMRKAADFNVLQGPELQALFSSMEV